MVEGKAPAHIAKLLGLPRNQVYEKIKELRLKYSDSERWDSDIKMKKAKMGSRLLLEGYLRYYANRKAQRNKGE